MCTCGRYSSSPASSEKMMAASEAASRERTIDREPIDHPKERNSYTSEYKPEVVPVYR